MTTRRSFLKATAATATLAGIPALIRRAGAAEPVAIATGFGFPPNFIEMMNACSGGHFARAGLNAKIIGTKGTAQTLQLLVAGQVQFARAAALDLMTAVTRQPVPLLSIATICQHSAFQLVSLDDKPVARAEELKGKTVGIVSVGGTTDMFLDLILTKVGLQEDDVQREPVGDNPGAVEFAARPDRLLHLLAQHSGGDRTLRRADLILEHRPLRADARTGLSNDKRCRRYQARFGARLFASDKGLCRRAH